MPFLFFWPIQPRAATCDERGEKKMKPLKSVEEAAGLLGISPWTVRGYIRDGKIKPVRLGRRVLVEEAELERFVADGKESSDPSRETGGRSQLSVDRSSPKLEPD